MINEIIKQLGSSASKLTLLIITLALVAGLFTGKISEDTFKVAALMIFTYYFTYKADNPNNLPYNGK